MSEASLNRRVILSSRPKGIPQAEHFSIDEVPVASLAEGQFLIKMLYWSVDPAMRGWANDAPNYLPPVALGSAMRAFAVGEIVDSRHSGYKQGELVSGKFGWQTLALSDGSDVDRKVTETDLSPSLALGVLGLNGITAYYGLLDICDPRPGETVVVSTAAGAVGSAVGQIASIKGARTVAITSSRAKVNICLQQFGFDHAISYLEDNVDAAIRETCPDGVDCYFDNTCGPISDAVLMHLAVGARITVCGTAAFADWNPIPVGPRVNRQLLVARARMQGFLVLDHKHRFASAVEELANWVRAGLLNTEEQILEGIEAAPGSISMLYESKNTGKLLVKP